MAAPVTEPLADLASFERALPASPPDALSSFDPKFRMFDEGGLEIWYAPVGRRTVVPRLWVLGITPGWQQMRIAYELACDAVRAGASVAAASELPKPEMAFAGSMRRNLIAMLDELGVPGWFETDTTANLFGTDVLRTGSALKYPVFYRGKNYTGHTPDPLRTAPLRCMLDTWFAAELAEVPTTCPILPLGKAVERILGHFVAQGRLDSARVVRNFPHPSGANGHRHRQFETHRESIQAALRHWIGPAPTAEI